MALRALSVLLFVALAMFVGQAAWSAEVATHEGVVVSAGDGKLSMTGKDGENPHTHQVAASVPITLDGEAATLDDLKAGFHVKVTTDDTKAVTKIEAQSSK